MRFEEFIEKVKAMGGVDTDGYYGKQCMDLYNYYCNNVLELQNVGADCAKNILNNPNIMNNVERINNYQKFVPQKGDIAVFTGSQYGHVAICLGIGDVNTFKTIDQNWQPQKITEETHNYTYMAPLVFLRPKNQKNIITLKSVDEIAKEVINGNWGNGAERVQRLTNAGYNAKEVQDRVNALMANSSKTYTVVKGDTLSAIATKFGTTYQELARKNGIANPDLIYPGQVLKI